MAKTKINFLTLSDRGKANEIIILHGFGGKIKSGLNFAKILAEEKGLEGWSVRSFGYTTGLAPNTYGIWTGRPSLPKLADLLRATIESKIKDKNRITLIAHSMGGLIVQRAILDDPEFRKRLSHVFLFGTPSDGLEKASFGRRFLKLFGQKNRQIRDMGHRSEFMNDLRARRPKIFENPSFVFRVTAGDKDEFVPARSSLAPFKKEFQRVVPGNHLQIIRPEDRENESVSLVVKTLLGDAAYAGPWNSARIAVEKGDFQAAIQNYEAHISGLDGDRLVELALAYEGTGNSEKALKILSEYARPHLDVLGTKAGRLKRRWLLQGTLDDAQLALKLYRKGYEEAVKEYDPEQAFYHGINIAFLVIAMNKGKKSSREEAQKIAREVINHCNASPKSHWRIATEAEALLQLGQLKQSLLRYGDFVATEPIPRDLASTYQQAVVLMKYLYKIPNEREKHLDKLDNIFKP